MFVCAALVPFFLGGCKSIFCNVQVSYTCRQMESLHIVAVNIIVIASLSTVKDLERLGHCRVYTKSNHRHGFYLPMSICGNGIHALS